MKSSLLILVSVFLMNFGSFEKAFAASSSQAASGLPVCSPSRLEELKAMRAPFANALTPTQIYVLSGFVHASAALEEAAKLLNQQQEELESRGAAFGDATQAGYSLGLAKGIAGLKRLSDQVTPCTAEAVRILAPADFSERANKQ